MVAIVIASNTILRAGISSILNSNFQIAKIIESESLQAILGLQALASGCLMIISHQDVEIKKMQIQIIRRLFAARIVICEVVPEIKKVREYINHGADGCFSIRATVSEFARCIEDVLNGRKYISPDFHEMILHEEIDGITRTKRERIDKLSARENEVARLLSEGKSVSWIAKHLEREISTISTIKKNVFKKLSVTGIVELNRYLNSEGTSGTKLVDSVIEIQVR